ncbi:MAG: TonB-dependent receptor [Muribaculaceae bacterium]|nr:TonB-dependent receptor [Muribaculaceae bacterium]
MKQDSKALRRLTARRGACMFAAAVSAMLLSPNVNAASEAADRAPVMASPADKDAKITVTGVITDAATGDPLIGASVYEKGKLGGTISDVDGKFSIKVASDATLEVSYVGYETQTIKVDGRTTINITMSEDVQKLDEVVVVGYASQKKANLTGAVASVDFEKTATSRPLTTLSAGLAGAAAGLNVMETSGKPNSEGSLTSIRGYGTLNNSSPLILVDGMEASLNDVNPNDVANISILKDAASCAIYGNRGANGVILITTKKGKEGRVNVTYTGKFSLNTPQKIIRTISNYADYMEIINQAYRGGGMAEPYSTLDIQEWREASKNPNALNDEGIPNYVTHPNTDWYDYLYQKRFMQEHTVGVTGQDSRTTYAFSGTFLHNPGIIQACELNKYYLRTDIRSQVTDFLALGMRAWGYHNDQNRDDVSQIWEIQMQRSIPGIYPYYNGLWGGNETANETSDTSNIAMNIAQDHGYFKQDKIYANPYVEVDLPLGFKISSNFYYDKYENHHFWKPDVYQPQVSFRRGMKLNFEPSDAQMAEAQVYDYRAYDQSWKTTNILNWHGTFGSNDVNALIGYEEMRKWGGSTDISKKGMSSYALTDFDAVTTPVYISGSNWEWASRSLFGRVNYAYAGKYLVEANFRYDGSSRFAKENRWGFFPSVSAGWRISEEAFMADTRSWLDNLKIRGSWGKLGNNAIGNYEYQNFYSSTLYAFGDVPKGGLFLTGFTNANLKWETTTSSNIGIDFGALNNRLTGVIELYDKHTDGILYRPSLNASLYYLTAPLMNLAEVDNKGLEITLGWNDRVDQVSYFVNGNVSFNRNRVTKYKGTLDKGWKTDDNGNKYWYNNIGDVSNNGGAGTQIVEGHQMNEYYTHTVYRGDGTYYNSDGSVNVNGGPRDGMIRTEADMKWLKDMVAAGNSFYPMQNIGKGGIWYGDMIYADTNGDGKYGEEQDRQFNGYSNIPKIYYGLQMGANWKGIDLSMNWSGAAGFKIWYYDKCKNSTTVIQSEQMPLDIAYDHYFYDPDNLNDPYTNTTSNTPRLSPTDGNNQQKLFSERHLQNGDYIKLKNLSVGYTFPRQWTTKAYVQNLRVYASFENLCTITKFKGLDPEMRAGDGYAPMRTYSLGLNLTF